MHCLNRLSLNCGPIKTYLLELGMELMTEVGESRSEHHAEIIVLPGAAVRNARRNAPGAKAQSN
jgi:hypothetical protein